MGNVANRKLSLVQRDAPGIRKDIQGLRALAVLAVVLYHSDLGLPGGFLGVDIFFVISGFVITASLLGEQNRLGRIRLGAFYWRRFRRLVPPLAAVVAVTLTVSGILLSPFGPLQTAAATGLAAMFSLANVVIAVRTGGYFDSAANLNPLLHTWTLSVEEQFYLVFPLVLILSLAFEKRFRHAVGIALVLVIAISFVLTVTTPLILGSSPTDFLGFYSPVIRAWEFGVGALLAWWLMRVNSQISRYRARLAYIFGLLLIGLSFTSSYEVFLEVIPNTVLPVLGTSLVVFAGAANPWTSDPLRARWVVLVGSWSYSIYLWHWPFIWMSKLLWPEVNPAPAATLSLLLAISSYYLLEKPLSSKEANSVRETSQFIFLILVAPVSLAIVLLVSSTQVDRQMGRVTELPFGYEAGCHGPGPVDSGLKVCNFDYEEDEGGVFLVGDSHAAHFTSGVRAATDSLGIPLSVITASGCPLLYGVTPDAAPEGGERLRQCAAWQEKVFDYLEIAPAGVVILGSYDGYWVEPHRILGRNQLVAEAEPERISLLKIGLAGAIQRLQSAGHEVIVVHTVPVWRGEYSSHLDRVTFWTALSGGSETMPLADVRSITLESRAALTMVTSKFSATVIDFSDEICPSGSCQQRTKLGTWIYRDDTHLTNEFSKSLQPRWQKILLSAENIDGK